MAAPTDQDLREVLRGVMDDLDAGRVKLPGSGRLGRWLGPPLLAAGLGLSAMACDARSVGLAEDAAARNDSTVYVNDAEVPPVDALPNIAYGGPDVDSGVMLLYGDPPVDSGPLPEYGPAPVDAGDDALYSVPPMPER
jgi:hypothetical protein